MVRLGLAAFFSRHVSITRVMFDCRDGGIPLDSRSQQLICPICQKRKAKRFCPAKTQSICSVCCGTEREVSIDCPSDCPHLVASRQPDYERQDIDPSTLPFPDFKIASSFVRARNDLLLKISYTICLHARDNSALVDSDVITALQSLAEAYRTLASGIVYQNPPVYRLQRELYQAVQTSIERHKQEERRKVMVAHPDAVGNGDIRDALVILTRLGAARSNGRPKSRAYLDFLRTRFEPGEFSKPGSGLLLLA